VQPRLKRCFASACYDTAMSPFMLDVSQGLVGMMHELVPVDLYPSGVLPIPANRIQGTAFYPGGSGLWLEGRDPASVEFPVGGVMILGHNFDSENGFGQSVLRGKECLTSGTWGPLVRLLSAAGVDLEGCFFTNAFMGLCSGDDSFVYHGRDDQPFRTACVEFLLHQIEVQKPRAILTLGGYVPSLVCEASENCSIWRKDKVTLAELDAHPVVDNVYFTMADGSSHGLTVVPLAHPSLPNNRRRLPAGFAPGKAGEIEIICKVCG
jgi:hypothetical protein